MNEIASIKEGFTVAAGLSARKIIGITGHMGAGKTTAASVFNKYGYIIVKFADPLKAMLLTLGMTDSQLNGAEKETPISWLGNKSPRYIQQTLGTEFGRKLIDENIWVNAWEHRINNLYTKSIISDDVRFPNEAEKIISLGGKIIKVVRPNYDGDSHDSEKYIDSLSYNSILYNDSTLDDFLRKVESVALTWST